MRGAMAGDADEELLARLGVVAADPKDYERSVLAQATARVPVQPDGKELELEEADTEEDTKSLLRDTDPLVRSRRSRIQEVLASLENEIAAVTSARDAFLTADGKRDREAGDADTSKKKKARRDSKVQDGGESMQLALLEERLQSLRTKRKNLWVKLKHLEDPAIVKESASGPSTPSPILRDPGHASTSGKKRGKEQRPSKPKIVSFVDDDDFDAALDAASGIVETERERLIRLGIITPFSKVDGLEKRVRARPNDRGSAKDEAVDEQVERSMARMAATVAANKKARPTTILVKSSELPALEGPTREFRHIRTPLKRVTANEDGETPVKSRGKLLKRKRPQAGKKWRTRKEASSDDENSLENGKGGSENGSAAPRRRRLRLAYKSVVDDDDVLNNAGAEDENLEDEEEEVEADDDVVLDGGLKIPGAIYNKLFDYQQTGVRWMWELHCQKAGGIIGDEMGLGKTIQVIGLLAALHYSGMYRPSIVVCPVTLLRQWKRELKKWYPAIKAEVLHESAWKGSVAKGMKKAGASDSDSSESESEEVGIGSDSDSEKKGKSSGKGAKRWIPLINSVVKSDSKLLITTYEQLRIHRERLLPIHWGYAILDEGHKIRNPDAEVTLVCKQLQTVRRLIMTGAPIQNRLKELWSLFDFVFPGKLGVLPVFQAQFVIPIQCGGYANATPLQASTAYKCAVVLRDLILPYLLRRMKDDVNADLTKKTEHVLFCSLTDEQRSAYRAFLASAEVEQIMAGSRNSLFGIDIMRKICNHPDLLEREQGAGHFDYGNPERSGKLKLIQQVLKLWKSEGHRVLLFAQTQQMLDILQGFAESQGYEYRRMDGSTPVNQRMTLMDEFNESEDVFLFILTTKVGGLGTNLTGANRVVIFDPDWNPSTDMQARERAWRIGQKRDVTIFRLITRGTIEEKVYHRQIYKQFLTNKILKDPLQRRIFKAKDLSDLFTLQEDVSGQQKTETEALFGNDAGDLMVMDREWRKAKDDAASSREKELARANQEVVEVGNSDSNSPDKKGKRKAAASDEAGQEDETQILKSLFEANGIHSAMNHDAIMAVNDRERAVVDREARRVAERAASELLRSRDNVLRSSDNVAVPTWTGRSGEAGAPASVKRRFGSTSNSRLLTPSAVHTTTTVSTVVKARVTNGRGVSVDNSSAARQVAELAAGTAAGKALSSSEIFSRMRERRGEAEDAGLVGVRTAGHSVTMSSASRFGRGSAPGQGSQSSTAAMPSQAGSQSVTGRGLSISHSRGQVSGSSSNQANGRVNISGRNLGASSDQVGFPRHIFGSVSAGRGFS